MIEAVTTGQVVLAINAGSSSVKCALFTLEASPRPLSRETIEGAGSSVVPRLLDWIDAHTRDTSLAIIGHRIVHGGPTYRDPQPITPAFLEALTQLIPFAPNHLPDEIALIGAVDAEDTRVLGRFLRDVIVANDDQRNFRIFGPDETVSNRLDAVFEATNLG